MSGTEAYKENEQTVGVPNHTLRSAERHVALRSWLLCSRASLRSTGLFFAAMLLLSQVTFAFQLDVSPGSIGFGTVIAGGTGKRTVTLSDAGSTKITVSEASVTGSDFAVSGIALPFTLGAGKKTRLSVLFTPASSGGAAGELEVVSDVPDSPAAVSLSGRGITRLLGASPAGLAFGDVVTGQTVSETVTISNEGTANVRISQVAASGTPFSTSGFRLPLTLAPGRNANLAVRFTPAAAGSAAGSISIVSNASDS
ncbi:MAG: choice-of-anchor D domain-containing protein, partial [Terriglobia bacterium]